LDNNIFNTSLYSGINDYVAAAHELAASDLHFVPDADRVNVFTRTNGDMRFQGAINHSEYDRLLNAFKFSSGLDVATAEFHKMHDYLCLPEMARCSCAFVSYLQFTENP